MGNRPQASMYEFRLEGEFVEKPRSCVRMREDSAIIDRIEMSRLRNFRPSARPERQRSPENYIARVDS
jgi:hypothetical protein